MTGARIFVTVCFVILGASFIASTGIFIDEFWGADWVSMLAAHSHLFFFFPVFGLLALVAFFLPSVVFTDLYWHHLPYGKYRYLAGLIVVAVLSYGVSNWLDAKPRAIWEVSPRTLAADKGEPAGCGNATACRRAPILATLMNLREAAQQRVGISKFARNCKPDALLEMPDDFQKERFCFPANGKMNGANCCEAQARFADAVARFQADPARRSLSGTLDVVFLPLKTFFVIVVVAIGLLLAAWRDRLDTFYKLYIPAIERGVIIGAFAMLIWPAMDYGYQETSNVLFGRMGGGVQFRLSLVIAPWVLLLLFYFLRRLGKNLERVGQISGVIGGAVAVLRYEQINDWAVRLLGTGSERLIGLFLIGIAFAGLLVLVWPRRGEEAVGAPGVK
jgi:hypothetical protein